MLPSFLWLASLTVSGLSKVSHASPKSLELPRSAPPDPIEVTVDPFSGLLVPDGSSAPNSTSDNTSNILAILDSLGRFIPPPPNATVFLPVPEAHYTHRLVNHTFGRLWKLQIALWDAFLWPNNIAQVVAINSSIWSNDVQGRVDVTRTFDGPELNTEYIFGLFGVAALNNRVPSMIGYPVSYRITHFAANQNIAVSSTTFDFYNNMLQTSVPFVIDTWITFNEDGQIDQYDAVFKWFDYAIDSMYQLWQTYLQTQTGYANATITDTHAWLEQESIAAICGGHEMFCAHTPNNQYHSTSDCVNFLSKVPFGKGYQAGMNTILCRIIHLNMVPLRPSVHCPHIGPGGGGMCVDDMTYLDKVLAPYFHNLPFLAYGHTASGKWNIETNKDYSNVTISKHFA